MPRCKKERRCRCIGSGRIYKPAGLKFMDMPVIQEIEIDEFEAMRLCDMEGKSQIEAAELMNISRGTIQRLLEEGRKKMIDAFLNFKVIYIKNIKEEENDTELNNIE